MRLPGETLDDVKRTIFPLSPTKFLLSLVSLDCLAVLLALSLGFALQHSPTAYTGEGDPITWLSFVHLLGIGGVAGRVFYYRTGGSLYPEVWRNPTFVWLLIALGFLFLAIDEVAKIHESLDHFVHRVLQIQETGLTDRLDDAIVFGYGCSGGAVLYAYRSELVQYRAALPLVLCGFVLFVCMGLLDALMNRADVFLFMGISQEGSAFLGEWLGGVEEGVKILAEAAFLGAAYLCLCLTPKGDLVRGGSCPHTAGSRS